MKMHGAKIKKKSRRHLKILGARMVENRGPTNVRRILQNLGTPVTRHPEFVHSSYMDRATTASLQILSKVPVTVPFVTLQWLLQQHSMAHKFLIFCVYMYISLWEWHLWLRMTSWMRESVLKLKVKVTPWHAYAVTEVRLRYSA